MLVLSRRPNQQILFPSIDTVVQVVSINGKTVRLGVDAPPEIVVLRSELAERPHGKITAPLAATGDGQFRALRHAIRNRLNGMSIGLALLRQQAQSGRSSELERTITLIESEMENLRQQVQGDAAPATPPAHAGHRLRKALLVEDDQNERELLAGFLRASGIDVDTAGDGCDALDHLHAGAHPDVVLLDMGLPRCDGATTAREIRRDPACAGLKIFAVTGHSPSEYNLDQGPAGIDRWFSKPIDPVVLLRELRQELRAI